MQRWDNPTMPSPGCNGRSLNARTSSSILALIPTSMTCGATCVFAKPSRRSGSNDRCGLYFTPSLGNLMHERDAGAGVGREQAAVQARSAELRKELSIADLAFAQILFIVGLQWVGVAAKQGPSHVIFWLIAIVLFYLPSAIVAVWLNRAMPLEGGLYQWAKIGFNEPFGFIVAWNLWLFAILNMTNVGLQFTQYVGYIFGPGVAD